MKLYYNLYRRNRISELLQSIFALVLSGLCILPLDGSSSDPAPLLLAPVNDMEITNVSSYFQWQGIKGSKSYEIHISTDPEFKTIYIEKKTINEGYHKHLYFPRELLPIGKYWWRVRVITGESHSEWSTIFHFKVNNDLKVMDKTVRVISPEKPLFLMRNRAWNPLMHSQDVNSIIPKGLEQTIIIDDTALSGSQAIKRAQKYQELGLDFVIWNKRCQVSLALIEYLFQNYSHCIGTAEGEHFSGMYWERGPEGNLAELDYIHRAWALCGKYGRFYFFANGDEGYVRWPNFANKEKEYLAKYLKNIVPMFKTTNGDLALHSYGAVQGLLVSGSVKNVGIWVDEWIWPCQGFGRLGEIIPSSEIWKRRRTVGTKECPWLYDIQMWLMGIVSGSTVFHLESAHQWTGQGKTTKHYSSVFLPFLKAVVEKELIPSREAFLNSTKIAVISDLKLTQGQHGGQYQNSLAFLKDIYDIQAPGGQDLIPNQSRYGIVCLLPPESTALKTTTKSVPLAKLALTDTAISMFEQAYPIRFSGNAFMWECDRTIIVTNSNENKDLNQNFSMALDSTAVIKIDGVVGVHQYLIGKIAVDKKSVWFQTNGEYPDRLFEIFIKCKRKPTWSSSPEDGIKKAEWNEISGSLKLTISNSSGAVNFEIK